MTEKEIADKMLDGMCYDEISIIALYNIYRNTMTRSHIETALGKVHSSTFNCKVEELFPYYPSYNEDIS